MCVLKLKSLRNLQLIFLEHFYLKYLINVNSAWHTFNAYKTFSPKLNLFFSCWALRNPCSVKILLRRRLGYGRKWTRKMFKRGLQLSRTRFLITEGNIHHSGKHLSSGCLPGFSSSPEVKGVILYPTIPISSAPWCHCLGLGSN